MFPYKIQSDDIIVALLGIKLDGETARVAGLVWKFTAECDSRESHEDGGLLADRRQEVRFLFAK